MPLPIQAAATNWPQFDESQASTSRRADSARSPEEQAAQLLASVQHPDLSRYLRVSPDGTMNKFKAVEQFQKSTEFAQFSEDMERCLKTLQTSRFSGSHCASYDHLIDRLELRRPNQGKTHYGAPMFDMYAFSCLYFKQILALLNHAKKFPVRVPTDSLEHAKPLIKNLEDELLVCAPGLLQKTEDTLNTLKHTLFPPGLLQHVNHTRFQIAQQHLGQRMAELFKDDPHLEGNHIHMVKVWMNELAPRLHIPFTEHDDQYANKAAYYDIVHHPIRLDIQRELAGLTSYSNAVSRIAEDTLQEARNRLSALTADERGNYKLATELVMKPLQTRFGNLPISSIFCESTASPGEFFIHDHPSLLVAELRDKLMDQSEKMPMHFADIETYPLSEKGVTTICKWGESIWLERKTGECIERDLLQLNDFNEDSALALAKAINWFGTKPDRLLYEAFVNHPDFSKLFKKLLADRKPESIVLAVAAWLTHSEHADAQILRKALNNAAMMTRFPPTALFEASTLLDFSDQQMDAALESLSQRGPFGHIQQMLNWTLLLDHFSVIDERAFKFILKETLPDNQYLRNAITHATINNQNTRLKLLIESTHETAQQRSDVARRILKRHCHQIKSESIADYLLSLKPQMNQGSHHAANLLELYINEASDPISNKVAKAWISEGHGDYHNGDGLNLVCLAASKHKTQTMQALLASTAFNLNAKDNRGRSALVCALDTAIQNNPTEQQRLIDICELLIKEKIQMGTVDLEGEDEYSHAMRSNADDATIHEIIHLLISHGAPDQQDRQGLDALGKACAHGRPGVVKTLLDRPGFIPDDLVFHHLCSLPANQQIDESTLNGLIKVRKFNIYKMLVKHGLKPDKLDANGRTPFEHAIANNQWNLAVKLLEQLPDIDRLESSGYNMLHKAVINRNVRLAQAILAAGADINTRSSRRHAGKTALHFALKTDNDPMYQLLLRLGASPNRKDFKLRSATAYKSARRTQQ